MAVPARSGRRIDDRSLTSDSTARDLRPCVEGPRFDQGWEMRDSQGPSTRVDARTGLIIMDRAECVELLERTPIGRVVFVDDEGQPIALPVNYRWHEDSVVFRTFEGQKLSAAIGNQRVSFEVDEWDRELRTGWSVLVKGRAETVLEWDKARAADDMDLDPWTDIHEHGPWVRVIPHELTGREVGVV